jgi:hypothetical protein
MWPRGSGQPTPASNGNASTAQQQEQVAGSSTGSTATARHHDGSAAACLPFTRLTNAAAAARVKSIQH